MSMGRVYARGRLTVLAVQGRVGVHARSEAPTLIVLDGRRSIVVDVAVRSGCSVTIAIVTTASTVLDWGSLMRSIVS